MPYLIRVLLFNLAILLFGLGGAIGCRADGVVTTSATSLSENDSFLCAVNVYPCLSTPLFETVNADDVARDDLDVTVRALGENNAEKGGATIASPPSDRDATFSVDAMGAGIDSNLGRFAFRMTLDDYYHGAIYDNRDLLQPFQLSINYARNW